MKLIKLHFVGFVDESSPGCRYIDGVLYDPVYIRADKIAIIYPHEDNEYPVPKIRKSCIDQNENLIEMVVDNFSDLTNKDYKQASVVTFDADYTACLEKDLRYQSQQPYARDYIIYESPEEIIRLINGEYVPLEVFDPSNDPRFIDFDDLAFTVRTSNILRAKGINTVAELIKCTEIDLLKFLGKKTITEIKDKLANRGLWLGMKR